MRVFLSILIISRSFSTLMLTPFSDILACENLIFFLKKLAKETLLYVFLFNSCDCLASGAVSTFSWIIIEMFEPFVATLKLNNCTKNEAPQLNHVLNKMTRSYFKIPGKWNYWNVFLAAAFKIRAVVFTVLSSSVCTSTSSLFPRATKTSAYGVEALETRVFSSPQ